jgi:aminoglycoside phosphotransferase (APT) family kinase protein
MILAESLSAFLSQRWDAAVDVENLHRLPGGASRETFSFDAVTAQSRRGLILRRDPPEGLIDTDRSLEYLAYRSFHPLGLPVPEALLLEASGGVLERPFFIMTRIDGGAAASPFAPKPYAPFESHLGRQVFGVLGRIAGVAPQGLPLESALEAVRPDEVWRRELQRWESELDQDELHPQPIARAALRRLRRRPPPPAQTLCVVHGDYRSGNFLHDGGGNLIAVLDWEMAHLGDPLEDLAWALDPLWSHDDPDRVAGLLPREEALKVWEQASGLRVDAEGLAWWSLFSSLKGLVIWISATKAFVQGEGLDPVLGFTGLFCARRHDEILARALCAELETGA